MLCKVQGIKRCRKIFTRTVLNEYEREFLENLPVTLNIKLDEIKFLLSHGSPGGDLYKYLMPDVSDRELEEELRMLLLMSFLSDIPTFQ